MDLDFFPNNTAYSGQVQGLGYAHSGNDWFRYNVTWDRFWIDTYGELTITHGLAIYMLFIMEARNRSFFMEPFFLIFQYVYILEYGIILQQLGLH